MMIKQLVSLIDNTSDEVFIDGYDCSLVIHVVLMCVVL